MSGRYVAKEIQILYFIKRWSNSINAAIPIRFSNISYLQDKQIKAVIAITIISSRRNINPSLPYANLWSTYRNEVHC